MKKALILVASVLTLTATSALAADAKANWEANCKGCHGLEGKGDTKLGQKMEVKDYSKAEVQAAVTDEKMFKSIKEGLKKDDKVLMKPYSEKLSDDEIKALVAYMRKFKK